MEEFMSKAITAVAALAIASLAYGSAQAGGASSAPSKYTNTSGTNSGQQARAIQTNYTITEFSSSSAKVSVPKR
jgi:hypothetical protein